MDRRGADAAALTPQLQDQRALDHGDAGTADDLAFHSPWGFDPASITIPAKVWHSEDDTFVPFGHGRWLADAIPGAERAFGDTDGHLTIVGEHIAAVHEWLTGHI